MLKEKDVRVWIGFIWLKMESNGGSCEHGNEPLIPQFLDQLSDYHLLKKDSTPRN
jgi:hypothetical protein